MEKLPKNADKDAEIAANGVDIMKFVLAPDSFKGSLSAEGVCRAMEGGIRRVFPEALIEAVPMGDGGEGTMASLMSAKGGRKARAAALDPLGREIEAEYGILELDGSPTAYIEMAAASGLELIRPEERNPLDTSTYGTGQLIRHALDQGIRRFIIGLGGSATNDGGAGMMQALGLRLLDGQGRELPPGGASLLKLERIDADTLDPRIRESEFTAACDVTNPLIGPNGASRVFGPQKGASPGDVALLDRALARYADKIAEAGFPDVREAPGSGAAGGMGAALLAFLGARMLSGIEMVLEATGFRGLLSGADLVLTGEGRLDGQTLQGKVIRGVCRAAREAGVPVVALCGSVNLTGGQMDELGLAACFSLVGGPCSLDEAISRAETWIADRAEQIMRLLRVRMQ